MRRVFIGIKISPELAERCILLQQGLADLPARFSEKEDLHVTLVPPLDMVDQRRVEATIQEVVSGYSSFSLHLNKLEFGPTPQVPRLAWIECDPSNELVSLRQDLVKAFEYEDRYSFRPHITLARFRDKDMSMLKVRSIQKRVDLAIDVSSVELFESVHSGGVTYTVLGSYTF